MLMGINFSEDEVFPGDLVKILNQLESELYGVCIDVNYITSGHTVRFSEWDLEKVA
jgi:hypothetical protein